MSMVTKSVNITTILIVWSLFMLSTLLFNNSLDAQEDPTNLESNQNQLETTEPTDKTPPYDYLDILAVPVVVAIIGAIAASWGFIQTRWSGHYFVRLIVKELGELEPTKDIDKNRDWTSYLNKRFIHREILKKTY